MVEGEHFFDAVMQYVAVKKLGAAVAAVAAAVSNLGGHARARAPVHVCVRQTLLVVLREKILRILPRVFFLSALVSGLLKQTIQCWLLTPGIRIYHTGEYCGRSFTYL